MEPHELVKTVDSAERERMRRLTGLYLVLLSMFFVFLLLFHRIVIFVDAGEAGVLFRRFFGGVVTTRVYGEGIQLLFPWDYMTVYNVRVQEQTINYHILTENGLSVNVDLSVWYHPEYDALPILHKRIGPEYLDKVIVPVVEAAVRKTAGLYTAEELYSSQGALLHLIDTQVRAELGQYFVILDEVEIKQLELPPIIKAAIEAKEERRHVLESYTYRLKIAKEEAVRKQIDALGWANFNLTLNNSLSPRVLQWWGIEATTALASSTNSKVVVVGSGADGLPVILGGDYTGGPQTPPPSEARAPRRDLELSSLDDRLDRMRSMFDDLIRRNRVTEASAESGDRRPAADASGTSSTTGPAALPSSRSER